MQVNSPVHMLVLVAVAIATFVWLTSIHISLQPEKPVPSDYLRYLQEQCICETSNRLVTFHVEHR
jgi:hypothetical protein